LYSTIDTAIPLYKKVKSYLEKLLDEGKIKPGEQLPSEKDLVTQFNVSRITVRRALQELVIDERITRIPGKGSFVLQPKIEPLTELTSFSENMRARGLEPSYRNTAIELVNAPPKVLQFLQLTDDDRALRIHRLLLADNIPMAVQEAYLPASVYKAAPQLFVPELLNVLSMYNILETNLGIRLVRAEEIVDASYATKEEAKLLSIKRGDLVLVITRLTLSENNKPIEYVKLVFRADRYRYRVELFRPPKKQIF
jgi:GntR family transcriptional regulator